MSAMLAEGGPLNGQVIESDAHVVRYPMPLPMNVLALSRGPQLLFRVVEYRRAGDVYRFETLIDDAYAEMKISEEAWFSEPALRRYARSQLRDELQNLAPDKEIDRIVWVLARHQLVGIFTLAGFVGGRRSERAAHRREQLRRQSA